MASQQGILSIDYVPYFSFQITRPTEVSHLFTKSFTYHHFLSKSLLIYIYAITYGTYHRKYDIWNIVLIWQSQIYIHMGLFFMWGRELIMMIYLISGSRPNYYGDQINSSSLRLKYTVFFHLQILSYNVFSYLKGYGEEMYILINVIMIKIYICVLQ